MPLSSFKIIAYGYFAITAIAASFFVYILYGVNYEATMALRYDAFSTLGNRAVQLDRLGRIGAVIHEARAIGVPDSLRADPLSINCDLDLRVKAFDPKTETGVNVVASPHGKINAVLIYHGRSPDFSPFLRSSTARELFGPVEFFTTDHPDLPSRKMAHYEAYDLVLSGKRLTWKSCECDRFTYTIFWEP